MERMATQIEDLQKEQDKIRANLKINHMASD